MSHDFNQMLKVNEIFYSIQGESFWSGLPCIFIRLTGCHQRCRYCDTKYAFHAGTEKNIEDILLEIHPFPCRDVMITGGEPLFQENTKKLIQVLMKQSYQVFLETSGSLDVSDVPSRVIKIMDLKTPASGECDHNNYENIKSLSAKDEVKFVVMDEGDVDWALDQVKDRKLDKICRVSVSPAKQELHPMIAEKILQSGLRVRQQTQLHKLIWPDQERGV